MDFKNAYGNVVEKNRCIQLPRIVPLGKIKTRREAAKWRIFWRVPCALRDDTLFDSGDDDAAAARARPRPPVAVVLFARFAQRS